MVRILARTVVSLMAVFIFSSTANANNHDKKLLAQVLKLHTIPMAPLPSENCVNRASAYVNPPSS